MTQVSSITFEDGYRRLQDIAERLNRDEVPVHEMCELFAEGKGLERALGRYLADQKARVEAIERGEGVQRFEVVAPGAAAGEPAVSVPVPAAGGTDGGQRRLGGGAATDDDIPF